MPEPVDDAAGPGLQKLLAPRAAHREMKQLQLRRQWSAESLVWKSSASLD